MSKLKNPLKKKAVHACISSTHKYLHMTSYRRFDQNINHNQVYIRKDFEQISECLTTTATKD